MELFPDGGFVRLQSRVSGKFVHAEGDWKKVTLRPSGGGGAVPSLNSVWRVEHVGPFVLLQNAAYGRYLSFTTRKAKFGHRGFKTTQRDRDEPVEPVNVNHPWMWTVERLDAPDEDFVSVSRFTFYLRANGRYFTWNNRVTTDVDPATRISTMMHWTVHEVATSPAPPQSLQVTPPDDDVPSPLIDPHPQRTIRHVRASDEEGEYDQNHNNWPSFAFHDSSLNNLRYELFNRQHDRNENNAYGYTLCMRPGSHGRLLPLVADLPRCTDSVNIVVFKNGTPGTAALVYPAGPAP